MRGGREGGREEGRRREGGRGGGEVRGREGGRKISVNATTCINTTHHMWRKRGGKARRERLM